MNVTTTFNFLPTEGAKVSHLVRTLTINGDPWFVAKDVCDVLGIQNSRDAVARLDDDERDAVGISDAIGRAQQTAIISESGLHTLVLRSQDAITPGTIPHRFRKWVTGTVLPAIRKTGSYVRGEEVLDPTAPDYLDRLKDLLIAAQEHKLAEAESKVAYLQPKADAFEVIEEATGSLTVTEAAKALNATSRKDLYAFLEHKNWVTKASPRQATAYAQKRGYMDIRSHTDTQGRIHTSPVMTPKGLAYLANVKATAKRKAA